VGTQNTTWSGAYTCSISFPGTFCRSGYCVLE
jgi:hypothetical protein